MKVMISETDVGLSDIDEDILYLIVLDPDDISKPLTDDVQRAVELYDRFILSDCLLLTYAVGLTM